MKSGDARVALVGFPSVGKVCLVLKTQYCCMRIPLVSCMFVCVCI